MTDRKTVFKIISGLVSLFMLLCMLIVAFFALLKPWSVAWFASNEEVNGSGMQVKVDGLDITISYYCKGPADADYVETDSLENVFKGLLPGDTVQIKVKYKNDESIAHSAKVFLSSFDGCEVPRVIEGEDNVKSYYYFGTQLKVVGTNEFLLTPPSDFLSYGAGEELTLSDLKVGDVTIPSGESAELEFSIQFVNYTDIDQSVYENFGNNGSECCYRIITSDFR